VAVTHTLDDKAWAVFIILFSDYCLTTHITNHCMRDTTAIMMTSVYHCTYSNITIENARTASVSVCGRNIPYAYGRECRRRPSESAATGAGGCGGRRTLRDKPITKTTTKSVEKFRRRRLTAWRVGGWWCVVVAANGRSRGSVEKRYRRIGTIVYRIIILLFLSMW